MEFIWGGVRKLFAFINAHSCKLKTLVHNSHFGSWEPLFNHFSLLILVSPSFLFKRFILSKFVNGPDVFYNLVNYCFSLQASWGTEHTWPEGTNFNNCFSKVRWICNAVFHLLKCQIKLHFLKLWQAFLFFFFFKWDVEGNSLVFVQYVYILGFWCRIFKKLLLFGILLLVCFFRMTLGTGLHKDLLEEKYRLHFSD